MSENHKIKVGISMGDPNGVGIEIVLKIFEDKRMFDFFTPIISKIQISYVYTT